MKIMVYWLLTLAISIIVTAALSGPVFYQRVLVEAGKSEVLGRHFNSIWTFRIAFYLQFFPLYVVLTMAIYWLYDRIDWFGNRWWIISLTLLLADRITATFWIWYFNKELPDMWMILGMIALAGFMTISMTQRGWERPCPDVCQILSAANRLMFLF